jgi:hypothetical protein
MKIAMLISSLCLYLGSALGQCNGLSDRCAKSIGKQYIVDPNFFEAELNPQDVASFRSVWLKGNTYRLSVCASNNQPCAVMVYDEAGNLLYDNSLYEQAQSWDFFPENTMHVQVIVRPSAQTTSRSCVSVITSFKK